MLRLGLRAIVLIVTLMPSYPANAQRTAGPEPTVTRGAPAFRLADRELIPEGMAYDSFDRSFYVGSLYKRKIVQVRTDGTQTDFSTAADGLWSVLGMAIDGRRRELWANTCNLAERQPPMSPDDESTRGQGGVFRYDLTTGKLIAKYLAGWAMAPRCFNDLALTPDGAVYVSSGPDGVYRVTQGSERVELFSEYHGSVNGIAASDDGRLLFLADHVAGIQVMDIATRRTTALTIPSSDPLVGIDGLYVRGRTLIGIQNGRRNQPARVLQAELSPSLKTATCVAVLESGRADYDIPTTGVLIGNDLFYIASSQMRRFNEDKTIFPLDKLTESLVLKTPLLRRCGNVATP